MTSAAAEFSQIPMSQTLAETLHRASEGARATGAAEVALEHVLAALCEDPDAADVLAASQIDAGRLRHEAISYLARLGAEAASQGRPPASELNVSPALMRILEAAAAAARGGRRREINGAIVLAAIVGDGRSAAAQMLQAQGLTFDGAIRALQSALAQPPRDQPVAVQPAEDVLARARERVQSRAAPSLREIMLDKPHLAPRQAPPPMGGGFPDLVPSHGGFAPAPAAPGVSPPPPVAAAPATGAQAHDEAEEHEAEVSIRRPGATHEEPLLPATPPAPDETYAADEAHAEPHPAALRPPPSVPPDSEAKFEPAGLPAPAPVQVPAPPAKVPPPSPAATTAGNVAPMASRDKAPPAPYPAQPPPAAPVPMSAPSHGTPGFGTSVPSAGFPPSAMPPAPPLPTGMAPAGGGHPFERPRIGPTPPPIPPPMPRQGQPAPGHMPGNRPGMPQGMHPGPPLPSASAPRAAPPGQLRPGQPLSGPQSSPHSGVTPSSPPGHARGDASRAELGQMAENVPRSMRVGNSERIEIRLARGHVAALTEGLEGGGLAWRHDVTVTKAMSVRLRAPDGGFFIETASPETQWIDSQFGEMGEDFASWRFLVTPQRRGWSRLQIIVSARTVGADGLAAETAFPDQVVEVKVKTNYARAAKRGLGWLVAAVAGGAVAKFGEGAFTAGAELVSKLIG